MGCSQNSLTGAFGYRFPVKQEVRTSALLKVLIEIREGARDVMLGGPGLDRSSMGPSAHVPLLLAIGRTSGLHQPGTAALLVWGRLWLPLDAYSLPGVTCLGL